MPGAIRRLPAGMAGRGARPVDCRVYGALAEARGADWFQFVEAPHRAPVDPCRGELSESGLDVGSETAGERP